MPKYGNQLSIATPRVKQFIAGACCSHSQATCPTRLPIQQRGYWPQKARFDGNRRRHAKRLDDHLFCEWLLWRSSYELSACTFFYGIRRYDARLIVLDNCSRRAKDSSSLYEDGAIEP